ncbi:hypothetical protein ACGF5M_06280 [Gemmatimonadota bacterium]
MWGLIPVALVGFMAILYFWMTSTTMEYTLTTPYVWTEDRLLVSFIIVGGALLAIPFLAVAYYFLIWPRRNPGHVDAGTPGPVGVQISSGEVHFNFRNDDCGKLFAESNRKVDGLRIIPPRP